MEFASYNAFRLAVQTLIEGEDIDEATFSVNSLDLMIGLGEERVCNGDEEVAGLRASTMIAPLEITPAADIYTLPDGILELHELYFDAARPIEIVSLDKLRRLGTLSSNASAVYAAQLGETLQFWPSSTTGIVYGSYYAKPDPLETGDWAFQYTVARYPDVYIYAALTEAMAFLGFDSRVPFWQSKFRTAMNAAMANETLRVYGASPMRMRAR